MSLEKIEEIFRDTGWCHLRSPTPHHAGTSPQLCHLFFPSISSFILLGTPCVSFLCSPESLYCAEKPVFLKPTSHTQTLKNKSPSVYRWPTRPAPPPPKAVPVMYSRNPPVTFKINRNPPVTICFPQTVLLITILHLSLKDYK